MLRSSGLRPSRVGKDGILHLEIPVGLTDKEVEIMVIYQPLEVPCFLRLRQRPARTSSLTLRTYVLSTIVGCVKVV